MSNNPGSNAVTQGCSSPAYVREGSRHRRASEQGEVRPGASLVECLRGAVVGRLQHDRRRPALVLVLSVGLTRPGEASLRETVVCRNVPAAPPIGAAPEGVGAPPRATTEEPWLEGATAMGIIAAADDFTAQLWAAFAAARSV